MASVLQLLAASPQVTAIPVLGPAGVEGVVSRAWLDFAQANPDVSWLKSRPCVDFADRSPIRVESDLDLAALTAILVESDARRLGDGFIIVARGGRYLGMGATRDVMRALQGSRVLAARYTNPLTLLPGQVPINEHLERLLARQVPFTTWFVEVDHMRGLNDAEGFKKGDALIHATARLVESVCERGVDFAGHVAGTRFVVLMQSEDWEARAKRTLEQFPAILEAHVPAEAANRGYFTARSRDGRESVRPLPKLVVGVLPVLPGVFETRHDVVTVAKEAAQRAKDEAGSALYIDREHGNAYPRSVLLRPS